MNFEEKLEIRTKMFCKCSVICSSIIAVLAIISLGLAVTISIPEELGKFDRKNVISQIKEDWETKPFVKIESFDGACPDGWDPVFERVWKGIEKGC